MLHFLEQDFDTAGRVLTIGPRRDRWSFGRDAVKATKWAPEIISSGVGGNTPGSEHWRAKMDVTFALYGALAQEPVLVEATSSTFTVMNLGRARDNSCSVILPGWLSRQRQNLGCQDIPASTFTQFINDVPLDMSAWHCGQNERDT